ncbi:TonB-dependent receptor domain-containing protein [Insolitispirillum peregrinum]|uniref:Outer membrane receptor proteins, mostly Fe transport n=1 Tax=Insolitispirillum peregrinum TaxID=80876 RepID=A0A1N7L1A3_9PROT|nr:TonB-dependent receptor [Insolitispirillum peregrinum]SIS67628.1 Outer membrane receptor proteins, mostly Fe transport [Insolitispirillum peregrinum]
MKTEGSRLPRRHQYRMRQGMVSMMAVMALCSLGGLTGNAVAADNTTGGQTRQGTAFAIPAQPLASALTAYGVQAGVQVAVDPAAIAGVTSPGVTGTYSAEQALASLLSGSGLVWQFTSPTSVVLERPAAGDSSSLMLAPVVVSGERVERSLRETASSVAVLDSVTLDERPDISGANRVTENVANIVTIEPSNHAPVVRGLEGAGPAIGANAFFAGVRPRLTVQMDGRPLSFNEMIFGDASTWDVEQVEVFRGPQSTVQGRNSIAGAIVMKTADPTYEPEGKIRLSAGNHDYRQVAGAVSGPIVEDQVAVRLAFERATSTSELKFQPYEGEDDPGDYQATTMRAKILLEPKKLEGFRTLVTVSHSNYEGPQAEYVKAPYGSTGTPYSINVATFNPRSLNGTIETTWELTDSLTFENHASLSDLSVRRHAPAGTGNVRIDGREASLEPRLHFTGFDGRVKGFGGYYGMRGKQDEFIDMLNSYYMDKTETDAVFGEATVGLTSALDLTLGGRLEEETRQRIGGTGRFAVDFDETYQVFLPKAGLAWRVDEQWTVGTTVSRGYNGGGAGVTFAAPFTSYSYDPEYVWNYEAYTRADLLDGALRLTGNVFYADYKDLQLPYRLAANSTVIRNAKEAATYGTELGARWRATPELEVFGDIGLLKTEILSYPGSGYEGNEFPQAPALTGTVGVSYHPTDAWELGGEARYSEAYYSDVANTARGKVDPYWVVNLHGSYDLGGPRLFGSIRNLLDTDAITDIGLGTTERNDYASMLPSRTFVMGVEASF